MSAVSARDAPMMSWVEELVSGNGQEVGVGMGVGVRIVIGVAGVAEDIPDSRLDDEGMESVVDAAAFCEVNPLKILRFPFCNDTFRRDVAVPTRLGETSGLDRKSFLVNKLESSSDGRRESIISSKSVGVSMFVLVQLKKKKTDAQLKFQQKQTEIPQFVTL